MKQYRTLVIGHITMDYDTDWIGKKTNIAGGAVLYSSASAYALGHKVAALTKVAPQDKGRLSNFTIPKDDVYCIESEKSTTMSNVYFTADKERRKSACTSKGDPFVLADIPADIEAEIYHFAGLIYGDFGNDLIKALAARGKTALDVQACLRRLNEEDGSLYFADWEDKAEMLPYITFLKTDAAEAEIMTGQTNRYEAAKALYAMGAKEVVITHNSEVIAYDGTTMCSCPIRARNLSGRTGRGDTTFCAYINERLDHDMETALLYATATVSNKMEVPGPYRGTRADVERYIRSYYPEYAR